MAANSSVILPINHRMTMGASCPALGKRAGWLGEVMTARCDDAVRSADLSIVDEGDNVVIGNPLSGVFVAVPPVGGVVVRALQEGASVAEAAAAAEQFAGEPVNVAGFVDRLRELGLIAGPARPAIQLPRTAAIQQRRWLHGPAPERVGWLFGRAAWTVYACMAAFDVGVLLARPAACAENADSRPGPRAVRRPAPRPRRRGLVLVAVARRIPPGGRLVLVVWPAAPRPPPRLGRAWPRHGPGNHEVLAQRRLHSDLALALRHSSYAHPSPRRGRHPSPPRTGT